MRRIITIAVALCALGIPASAMADDPPNPPDTQSAAPTPLAAPVAPTAVTDENGASNFAKFFLIRNAGQLVPGAFAIDVDVAACRQVDAVQRFYCLATARLVQVQRIVVSRWFVRSHNRSHSRRARAAGDGGGNGDWSDHRDNRHNDRRQVVLFRVRLFACVAVVRIQGGPAATPTATIPVRNCVQIQRPPTAASLT